MVSGRLLFAIGTFACASSSAPAQKAEAPRGDSVLVMEPAGGDDAGSHREPDSGEPRDAPAPAPIDVSTLPPGPVTCSTCGPAPGYPSWGCPDGVHHGGRGPCVKLSDGRCGWLNLICPAQKPSPPCSASECGAWPDPARWRCPDEAHSGEFTCVRSDDGGCGWTEQPCLGSANVRPPPPPPAPPPPPFRGACDPLPSLAELKKWEVTSICHSGGGPVQPERDLILSLGDGTHIFQDARGCFRARYRQCNSK